MTAPAYFVILAAMRTGSNLLETTLAELPGLACFGEVFNPGFLGKPKKSTVDGWDVAARDADPLGCLRALVAQGGGAIPGFRLFDGHEPRALAHVLADPACARIVLRRDPVESYVSLLIARATDQWMLRIPRRRRQARVRFDAAEFATYCARLAAHYARMDADMARAGTTAHRIDYADLLAPDTVPAVARHIGIAIAAAPPPNILRQNPEPLAQKVENHAEMLAALAAMGVAAPSEPMAPPSPLPHPFPHRGEG